MDDQFITTQKKQTILRQLQTQSLSQLKRRWESVHNKLGLKKSKQTKDKEVEFETPVSPMIV